MSDYDYQIQEFEDALNTVDTVWQRLNQVGLALGIILGFVLMIDDWVVGVAVAVAFPVSYYVGELSRRFILGIGWTLLSINKHTQDKKTSLH